MATPDHTAPASTSEAAALHDVFKLMVQRKVDNLLDALYQAPMSAQELSTRLDNCTFSPAEKLCVRFTNQAALVGCGDYATEDEECIARDTLQDSWETVSNALYAEMDSLLDAGELDRSTRLSELILMADCCVYAAH